MGPLYCVLWVSYINTRNISMGTSSVIKDINDKEVDGGGTGGGG